MSNKINLIQQNNMVQVKPQLRFNKYQLEDAMYTHLTDDQFKPRGRWLLVCFDKDHKRFRYSNSISTLRNYIDDQHNWFVTLFKFNRPKSEKLKASEDHNIKTFVDYPRPYRRLGKYAKYISGFYLDLDTNKAKVCHFNIFGLAHYLKRKYGLKATVIVHSGHGYYLKYVLSQLKPCYSSNIYNLYKHILTKLGSTVNYWSNKHYGVSVWDSGTEDKSRVLRMSGSINWKCRNSNNSYTKPIMCKILYINVNNRYSFNYINSIVNQIHKNSKEYKKWLYSNKRVRHNNTVPKLYIKKLLKHPFHNFVPYAKEIGINNKYIKLALIKRKKMEQNIRYKHKKLASQRDNEKNSVNTKGKYKNACNKNFPASSTLKSFKSKVSSPCYFLSGHVELSCFIYLSIAMECSLDNEDSAFNRLVGFAREVIKPKCKKEKQPISDQTLKYIINHLKKEVRQYTPPDDYKNQKFYYLPFSFINLSMDFGGNPLRRHSTRREKRKKRRAKRIEKYRLIGYLYHKGMSVTDLAKKFHKGRSTIYRHIRE